jgi:PAS domain S-box-containing protein
MLPGFSADASAARLRADRAVGAVGRLSAGLAGAFGVLAPVYWHAAGQSQQAPHTLGAAWALTGVAAWCSGAHRRSAALTFGSLGLMVGVWAGLSRLASPLETVAVCFAAIAVLVHDRDVNAPPSELLGHGAVLLIALGTAALGAQATGVPIDLGWAGSIGGRPRLALATWLAGVGIAATAWLDSRRDQPGGPHWFATLAGSIAGAITLVLWWALSSREAGLAAASGSAAPSQLPTAVLGMGIALAGLLTAVVALGQRARARSAEAQQTSHQLLEALVDRNIARDALERREALLQTVLETMGEGVVASSATGEFLVFNRAARELLGSEGEVGPAAIEWADMAGATDPQVWPAGEQTLERALRGESIDDLDICLRRSDGRDPRWVSVFARPLSLPAGLHGSMLVLRDVTERRLAQERVTETARELERSNRELTEFAAVASHDLRAPLRSVTSFVNLIEEDYGEAFTDEGRTYVTRIKAAVTRMTGLIDGLLTLAGVRAKGEPFMAVQLSEVAQDVVADLTHGLAESRGTVEIGPLPSVEADRLQMRQLLQNLIGNAIKFSRPGVPPRVVVSASPVPRGDVEDVVWELRVADNGIGLDPAHAEKIFKPFERLHAHASYEGSGLGLAVCARIVERHGGRIRAEGQPGIGTTLIVTLPAAHRRREAAA